MPEPSGSLLPSTTNDPSDADLCNVDDIREFIQKPTVDTDENAVIQSLIVRASRLIIDECDREFAPTAEEEAARVFTYSGGGYLSLSPYDARTVSEVRIDVDEDSPTTLEFTEWRLYPYPAVHGVATGLQLAPYILRSRSRWNTRLVEVTGLWGFPAVPSAVTHAAVLTVTEHLRRNVQAFSTVFRLDEGIVERPMSIPSAAWSALQPYKRMDYR